MYEKQTNHHSRLLVHPNITPLNDNQSHAGFKALTLKCNNYLPLHHQSSLKKMSSLPLYISFYLHIKLKYRICCTLTVNLL